MEEALTLLCTPPLLLLHVVHLEQSKIDSKSLFLGDTEWIESSELSEGEGEWGREGKWPEQCFFGDEYVECLDKCRF